MTKTAAFDRIMALYVSLSYCKHGAYATEKIDHADIIAAFDEAATRLSTMSHREAEARLLSAEGFSQAEIALQIGITQPGVNYLLKKRSLHL